MADNGWSERAEQWVEHWPRLSEPARQAVADAIKIGPGATLLDAGCGSGEFLALAASRGARTSGIDAAPGMIAIARRNLPHADLRIGPIDPLPWDDGTFDVVTAFNSLQFTDDISASMRELARVGHRVAVCNWGPRDQLDLAVVFQGVAEPDGATEPAPIPVGDPGVLEGLMEAAGLTPEHSGDVAAPYETPDLATLVAALRDASGFERATDDLVREVAAPFRRPDGSYRFENTFRYVVARS